MTIFTMSTLTRTAAAALTGAALLGAPVALASAADVTSSPATSITASAPGVIDDDDDFDNTAERARDNALERARGLGQLNRDNDSAADRKRKDAGDQRTK